MNVPQPVSPDFLGDYEAPTRLAFGGMAELFLAWQRGANGFTRQVVLKRILPQLASDRTFLDLFLNEARIASTLSHPNIVSCYDLIEAPESPVIVMEYVHGATIRDIATAVGRHNERLPYGQVVRIMAAVCDALDHAYNGKGPDLIPRRIIHRDVTPTNVMVSIDGEIKLTDFGIAKAMQSDVATRTRTLRGNCAYMAPELVLGEPMDHRADIFSVGVILFELTTGRRLFRRDTDMATMNAIMRYDVPDPSTIVPGYPASLKRIMFRAMAREREDRYKNAGDLGKDLRDCAIEEGWATERSELAGIMKRLFPDRLMPAQPPQYMPSSKSQRIRHITASLPTSSTNPAIGDSAQQPSFVQKHWEIIAVAALVVSALFWVWLTL